MFVGRIGRYSGEFSIPAALFTLPDVFAVPLPAHLFEQRVLSITPAGRPSNDADLVWMHPGANSAAAVWTVVSHRSGHDANPKGARFPATDVRTT